MRMPSLDKLCGVLFLALVGACESGTGPPKRTARTLAYVSGSQQQGLVGATLSDSLTVRVLDQNGEGLEGVSVQFTSTSGTTSPAEARTGVDGYARAAWTLGTSTGDQAAAAISGDLGPVSFTARAAPRAASRLEKGGDDQRAAVGTPLPASVTVRATDEFGNPVAGVAVTWSATAGGGTISPLSQVTDADGYARATWLLGTRSGSNTASATVANATVAFVATGTAGPLSTLSKVAGDEQTIAAYNANAVLGQECSTPKPLPAPLRVRANDAYGNPVPGAAITWGTPSGSISARTSVTSADGEATTTWAVVSQAGSHSASAAGANGASVAFRATVVAGGVGRLVKVSGDGQTVRFGETLPEPLVVRVTDSCANAIAGVGIAWGGNTLPGSDFNPSRSVTSAAGLASTSFTARFGTGERLPISVKLVDPAYDQIGEFFFVTIRP